EPEGRTQGGAKPRPYPARYPCKHSRSPRRRAPTPAPSTGASMRQATTPKMLLAAALVATTTLGAKPSTPAPEQPSAVGEAAKDPGAFFENVNVDVVNVEVYVTDKSGNTVNGLTKDDFTVLEDDRPVAITNFYSVDEKTPRPTGLPLPPPVT